MKHTNNRYQPNNLESKDLCWHMYKLVFPTCSFHVGSGCQTSSIYGTALTMSKELFQYGKDVGFNFTLLDIGGGFPGTKDSYPLFSEVSATINAFLTKFFHPETYPNLTVISEPGIVVNFVIKLNYVEVLKLISFNDRNGHIIMS